MTSVIIALFSLLSLLFGTEEAEIVFVGDAMMHQGQIDAARTKGGEYDYSECFKAFAPYIQSADYAVVNLETPVSTPPFSGYPCFNSPSQYLDALANAGFDLFLTANNHTLDRRDKGLRNTISALDSRHLAHIGTYSNAARRAQALPFIADINGIKTAFLNYTYGTNGITIQGDVVVDYIDRAIMAADIAAARKAGAEIITVCVHWGKEYQLLPHSSQKSLADFLVSKGVDLVIGSHPHVIQPMEVRHTDVDGGKDVLVVYSLGNFISNMKTRDTRGGALVKVKLTRDEYGKARLDKASYRLHFTVPAAADHNFRVFDAYDCRIPQAWRSACEAFTASALSIFSKHNISVAQER